MFVSAIIPFTLWRYGPVWLRPYLLVFGVILAICIGVVLWRYIASDKEAMENFPSRSEYRWQPGWTIARYHRALLTYLKINDWRIRSAEAVDADRLLICLQRDRHRLPVLLLRPGRAPTQEDIDYLRDVQHRDNVWEAALISDGATMQDPQIDERGAKLMLLDYEALPSLPEALDGGPEDERRARAEREERALRRAAAAEAQRMPRSLYDPVPEPAHAEAASPEA